MQYCGDADGASPLPPIVYEGADRKGAVLTYTGTTTPRHDIRTRPSQQSLVSQTKAGGSSTAATPVLDYRESTSPRSIPATVFTRRPEQSLHYPMASTDSGCSTGATGPTAQPVKQGHQTVVGDHALIPSQSSSAASKQVAEHPVLQEPIPSAVADLPSGERSCVDEPIVGNIIADSADRNNVNEESNERSARLGNREILRHVDSGIRLGGESSLLRELPPVYSPT